MIFKAKPTYDWLVVGLGNPGLQYENTRHNAGFMAVDKFAEDNGFKFNKNKYNALLGECKIGDLRILVIKPQTYMNNSGSAVAGVSTFYKIPAERIIVLHDDISFDVGKLRMRRKGSDGGQKGLRDIIELLGTEDITRIKIGVGRKPHPDADTANWVLGKIPKEQTAELEKTLEKASAAVKEIILRGIDSAMNKYNS
ncbi:MAG: aminoacyl-tRNA hydrolase [Acutalibacteraceae bacterium]|nr:aminoacyl-tRNA hydrolase [Acutalibacteraceae bacterium]